MNISEQHAMHIVTEISGIIGQHVNMMDENGIIIASTNPARIGTYHEGAARLITEKREQLIIQNDEEFTGARKGINLPVVLHGKIVGVIGVTGEYDQVVKYVQIIKKMTEVFLLENYLKDQERIDKRIKTRFLDEWLFEDVMFYSPDFIERGARLGIDITARRRILAAQIENLKDYSDNPEGQMQIDHANSIVRQITEDGGNVFAKTASQMICLISDCTDSKIRVLADEIQSAVAKELNISLLIGIDKRSPVLHHAYLEAKKALQAAAPVPGKTIRFYEDVDLEIFMDEISENSKKEYISQIFRGYDEAAIASWIQLLQVYFETNGSIGEAADRLYIHKNTLQYKLKKLREQTGHDPRILSDSALFYLAIEFYRASQSDHILA